ncbi:MAG: hypothetical protein RL444_1620 [Verrucomicrobiota bacterium]|jgi:hypothetical protein
MRLLSLLTLFLLAPCAFAVEEAAAQPAKKAGRAGAQFPESVPGVSDEQYAKIRRAIMATFGDEAIAAARKRLADLKERTRFVKGRNEAEDLRVEFETARDAMVKATIEAVQKFDPSVEKDPLVLTLNAIEDLVKKRGQEAAKAAQAKASEAERAAAKENKDAKTAEAPAAEAKPESPKAMSPAELLADVEGVSAEDMRKFRAAAFKAQRDPKLKEIKAKQTQLRKEAEFLSPEEKKNMRGEFEALLADMRKAQEAAIAEAAPSLSKETIVAILNAVEERAREAAAKAGPKKGTKTPLKPFPFGEKK